MGSEVKRVVGVSIGSPERDHSVEVDILGQRIRVERIGTDGDKQRAIEMIRELDGKVAAIGLGGIDVYLYAMGRRYIIRDGKTLADAAKQTVVVDGSGMKNTLERIIVRDIAEEGKYLEKGTKVLLCSAVDRFGMAESLVEAGCDVTFGDLMFGLGVPIPVKTMTSIRILAAILLPVVTRMPIELIYPTGKKQKSRKTEFAKYFEWAEVIAGDFLYINRKRPEKLTGKTIITNTVTRKNEQELKEAGVKTLITTTPEFEGRSFGTNVFEAICCALLDKKFGEVPTEEEYIDIIRKMSFGPRVKQLN